MPLGCMHTKWEKSELPGGAEQPDPRLGLPPSALEAFRSFSTRMVPLSPWPFVGAARWPALYRCVGKARFGGLKICFPVVSH